MDPQSKPTAPRSAEELLVACNIAFAAMTPLQWKEEEVKRELWEATLTDGLDDFDPEPINGPLLSGDDQDP